MALTPGWNVILFFRCCYYIYNSLLGYLICQSHLTEEKGGRCREEAFPECLLLCQILRWHYASQVPIAVSPQCSCELGGDTHTPRHIGSPPVWINTSGRLNTSGLLDVFSKAHGRNYNPWSQLKRMSQFVKIMGYMLWNF